MGSREAWASDSPSGAGREPEVERSSGLVDLDLKDVDIANACRLLADVGRANIVVADDVHGSVTVRLRRVPWERALDLILRTKGFHAEREADVIMVRAK